MQLQDLKSQLTFVFPVRIDCEERRENLRVVLRQLDGLGCRMLVLEADAVPALGDEAWPDGVEYTFVEDASTVFHRTRYINELLRMAGTEVVGVWDTDVLVGYAQIGEAVQRILEGCTIAYPYNGKFAKLSEPMSVHTRKNLDLEYLRHMKLDYYFGRRFFGGAYLVHRQRYFQCGGENERFTSWGPEDSERMHRVRILGHKVAWTRSGQLYHLYHPRGVNSGYRSEADADRLRRELVKICCMDKETLENYLLK